MSVQNPKMLKNKTLVLIDGNAAMHRAYHGVNKNFNPTWNNMPVGMVYGFASTLLHTIDHFRPDLLVVTFDTKEKTFRHEMDEAYKAQREKAPDDFYAQIPLLDELLSAFALPTLKLPGYESDDIIGTLAVRAEEEFQVRIISGDLDFTQLVNERIRLVKFAGKIDQSPEYGPAETLARYGVTPAQMIDFKAITGDSSDNYKGIAGVGPKTAEKLMKSFKSLDGIYENLDQIESDKIRQKLINQKDYAYHCQKLAEIHKEVPVEFNFDQSFNFAPESTVAFFEKMGFRALVGRYQRLVRNYSNPLSAKTTQKQPQEEQLSLF